MEALRKLEQTLLGFVAQGQEYVLLLDCRDFDVPLCLKVLEAVDQNAPQDVFLRFGHPITSDPDSYIDSVMATVAAQIAGANVLRAQDELPPWPDLPPACEGGTPPERLDALLDHVGSLWPAEDDHRVLWAFLPESIADPVVYASVVAPFLPRNAAKPGHRIVLRAHDQIVEVVRRRDDLSACLLEVDLSPEAMADEFARSAADSQTPPKKRALDLLILAGFDFSHRRYAESARKYGAVYAHFEGEPDSQGIRATCLMGVGDVARQTGQPDVAKDRYRQALALAAPLPDTLAIAMIACGQLGDLCHQQAKAEPLQRDGELAQAEGYYDLANQIATKLCNLPYKADILEKLGAVQRDKGDDGSARRTWVLARDLCVEGGYEARLHSVAERLRAAGGAP